MGRSRFGWVRARRGAAALEFALVCAPFVAFLLALGVGAYDFYVRAALDYATAEAARQIQIGNVAPGTHAAAFISRTLCPLFSPFQSCAGLFVDAHPVADFQSLAARGVSDGPNSTDPAGFVFCPGLPGQLVYLHVVYFAPSLGTALLPGGSPIGGTPVVANAALANENPSGVPVLPQSGC